MELPVSQADPYTFIFKLFYFVQLMTRWESGTQCNYTSMSKYCTATEAKQVFVGERLACDMHNGKKPGLILLASIYSHLLNAW